MKTFKIKWHSAKRHTEISNPRPVKWAEVRSEDIRIAVDGTQTNNTLLIVVEANGIKYMLTDVLLEVMLGQVAEQFSN